MDPQVLDGMMLGMSTAPNVFLPSPFWKDLAEVGRNQLVNSGFENFKRTINMRYFSWNLLGIVAHQMLPIMGMWFKKRELELLASHFPNYSDKNSNLYSFNYLTSLVYKFYVCALWDHCSKSDPLGLTDHVDEPDLGNPFMIKHRGRQVTQDLCNSIHELYSSTSSFQIGTTPPTEVAELGAGYGRLAYLFLKAFPECKYTIIDIPPALYVSQTYLSQVFPNDKVFKYRDFSSYAEIKDEFEAARIRFLLAPQIKLLPKDSVDLFVTISSLHEMTLEQISTYLQEISRITAGSFYTKQWRKSRTPINGFSIREDEYLIPVEWRQVFHQRHPIQRLFFEALYQTRN